MPRPEGLTAVQGFQGLGLSACLDNIRAVLPSFHEDDRAAPRQGPPVEEPVMRSMAGHIAPCPDGLPVCTMDNSVAGRTLCPCGLGLMMGTGECPCERVHEWPHGTGFR